MKRTLSSPATYFYKVVLPVLWIGTSAIGSAVLFLVAAAETPLANPPPEGGWGLLAFALVGAAEFLLVGRRLKTVSLEDGVLVVSDSGREVRVPLGDVERVTVSVLNSELVWVHLRRVTEFGAKIVFMPPWRFWRGFTPHPMAAELTALARKATGNAGGRR